MTTLGLYSIEAWPGEDNASHVMLIVLGASCKEVWIRAAQMTGLLLQHGKDAVHNSTQSVLYLNGKSVLLVRPISDRDTFGTLKNEEMPNKWKSCTCESGSEHDVFNRECEKNK